MIGMEDTDMPCIVMYTNVEVPKEKAEELKKALVVSWEKLPGKSEQIGRAHV